MTTIGGRPGGSGRPGGGGVATVAEAGEEVVSRRRSVRARTVLALARAEAAMLARSPLVLAGLLAGGVLIWILIRPVQPLWWKADWQIGGGQLALGMTVLVAAQLVAGRARRDAMTDLYASLPAAAGSHTVAHLIGLAGAAPASVLLAGAAAVAVQWRGAVGAPSLAVLASGVLLVIAVGAAGVAIGTRFAHPLAGVLGALVLFVMCGTTHLASGAGIWLPPWLVLQNQLGNLPGPLPGYPPVGGHALELAGIAAVAGIAALAVTVAGARARGSLLLAGLLAVAVTCFAGAVQLRPIPTADLNRLVTEIADPPAGQHCTTVSQVTYCLYPDFGRDLQSLEAPVSGVLAHVPARPGQSLAIRQTIFSSLDSTLTHGHPQGQVSEWNEQLRRAPDNATTLPVIYLTLGSWPAGGGQLADARFQVAMAAADWAVRLPFPVINGQPCVPLDQAREAIAIWLAIQAVHGSPGQFSGGLGGPGGEAQVGSTVVPAWTYPVNANYLTGILPQYTAAGYLLASAMTDLPARTVMNVLDGSWTTWLNWHTTDARLAAALGIRMPRVPVLRAAGPGVTISNGGGAPQYAACGP
jgi:hypothetical protein